LNFKVHCQCKTKLQSSNWRNFITRKANEFLQDLLSNLCRPDKEKIQKDVIEKLTEDWNGVVKWNAFHLDVDDIIAI
jgi:hypothetical protein